MPISGVAIKRAKDLYEQGWQKEDPEATTRLGLCHERGLGCVSNPKKAAEYYRLASEHDYAPGQFHYGRCFEHGIGIISDDKKAIQYYQLAAEQDYAPAAAELGRCYETGNLVFQDLRKALEFYRKAADSITPNPVAQCRLGLLHQQGKYVEKNLNRAVEYFSAAKDQEHPLGYFHFGRCLELGLGLSPDPNQAFQCYQFAVDKGAEKGEFLVTGMFALARCYQKGFGVAADFTKAKEYFLRIKQYLDRQIVVQKSADALLENRLSEDEMKILQAGLVDGKEQSEMKQKVENSTASTVVSGNSVGINLSQIQTQFTQSESQLPSPQSALQQSKSPPGSPSSAKTITPLADNKMGPMETAVVPKSETLAHTQTDVLKEQSDKKNKADTASTSGCCTIL
jgi:TPR repeat protein